MMTKPQIRQEINIILLKMGIPAKAITDQASFYKDLGLDSLDFAELIIECEIHLGIDMNCTEVENLKTVKDIIDYVSQVVKHNVPAS